MLTIISFMLCGVLEFAAWGWAADRSLVGAVLFHCIAFMFALRAMIGPA